MNLDDYHQITVRINLHVVKETSLVEYLMNGHETYTDDGLRYTVKDLRDLQQAVSKPLLVTIVSKNNKSISITI